MTVEEDFLKKYIFDQRRSCDASREVELAPGLLYSGF